MPIYAFECSACGYQFERLQRLADADPTLCPECGAEQVRRQLTAPSFRLAGAGWYETDFKKDGDKKRNLVDKKEGSGDAAPAKPDAAAASKPDSATKSAPDSSTAVKPEPKAAPKPPPSSTTP